MNGNTTIRLRTGQTRFLRLTNRRRLSAFLARRQYGKTTTFAAIALRKMLKQRDHTIIFGSAKIDLSREIVRKEASIIQNTIRALTAGIDPTQHLIQTVDSATGSALSDTVSPDDYAQIFEAQRLELRIYHDRSSYSRTKVVALRPDTVGETGDLMADEIGRIRNWRETWEAIEPIVASQPDFRLCLATTIPPDDAHYSYEMLMPPLGQTFNPDPAGNIYTSEMGIQVLRVDAFDAYADGIPLYDLNTGEPLTPQEHRRRAADKDAWDRNYGLVFLMGGTSACGILELDTAQRRGIGRCALHTIDSDNQLDTAIAAMLAAIAPVGDIGLGWDLATTEKGTSNPSAFAVVQQDGSGYAVPAIFLWKTADDAIALDRAKQIVRAIAKTGRRARALHIDATNERYFANSVRRNLAADIPVKLIIASETIDIPGQGAMTYKQHLNGALVGDLQDNRLTLPPERYIYKDWRLVKRTRGSYDTEIAPDGAHGDTFDGVKLGRHALAAGASGPTQATAVPTGSLPPDSKALI